MIKFHLGAFHTALGFCTGKLRDELLNVKIFTTLFEAQVLIENWRKDYNQIRPTVRWVTDPLHLRLLCQAMVQQV